MKDNNLVFSGRAGRDKPAYPLLTGKTARVTCGGDVVRHLGLIFKGQAEEQLVVLWMNCDDQVYWFKIVKGEAVERTLGDPAPLFRHEHGASGGRIIVARSRLGHQPGFSAEDLQVAMRLCAAVRRAGSLLRDYVVFTEDRFFSLADRGILFV